MLKSIRTSYFIDTTMEEDSSDEWVSCEDEDSFEEIGSSDSFEPPWSDNDPEDEDDDDDSDVDHSSPVANDACTPEEEAMWTDKFTKLKVQVIKQ